jgi:hypothetical protein
MLDNMLVYSIEQLDLKDLRKLHKWIGERIPPTVVYQQKPVKCGCEKCKEGGKGHGLYWYAYFTYQNKTHCIYIGKEKREINPLEELERKKSRRR